ncbi:MAG: DUF2064 domain-containing protein [Lewinellaceae bacterium]|nr:DUF2064 domain-containing protein [Lewinellaceae bacterium]
MEDVTNFKTRPSATLVMVFLREERAEIRAKRWRSGLAMVRALNRQAIKVARQSGFPVQVIRGSQQRGTSFGQRLGGALADVFQQETYQQVLVIGNDCPSLTIQHLRQAARLLQRTDLVLGPALDGGVYLIGITAQGFSRKPWEALPWQTAALQAGLCQYSTELNTALRWLNPARDADNQQELHRELLRATGLINRLYRLIQAESMGLFCPLPGVSVGAVAERPLSFRGPPLPALLMT